MTSDPVLVADGLCKNYGSMTAVRDVCLTVETGEILGIIGESGAGKTTLLKLLARIEEPSCGAVRVNAPTFLGPPAVLVWQELALFDHLTVLDNIEFGLRARGTDARERRQRAKYEIERFRLQGLSEKTTMTLSGGQRQRVALARATILSPPVLLLDEPFGSLDAILRDDLRLELRNVAKTSAIVFVSHDRDDVYELADRVIVLTSGTVSQQGPVADLFAKPSTRFVALFSGQYNLLSPATIGSVAGCSGAAYKKIAIRRSMISQWDGSQTGVRTLAITVSHCQLTPDGLRKVYANPDEDGCDPFVYFESAPATPQRGARVTLCWHPSAEVCL
jgi:ABC-type sulfate/molybdate transport systems ATPase subunit